MTLFSLHRFLLTAFSLRLLLAKKKRPRILREAAKGEGRDYENAVDNVAHEMIFARGFRLGVRLLPDVLREM